MRRRLGNIAVAAAILALLTVALLGLDRGRPSGDRAYALERQLRCPVCTSVSIAESTSGTATAMRAGVEEQIAAGRSDQQIVDYFRARYGDWVLLDPPARGTTLLLWALPVGALVLGVAVLALRRTARPDHGAQVDETDRAQIAAALARLRADDVADQP